MGSTVELPPGFRFHPTDEELITHYLKNQVVSRACPVPIIPELNIYKFDPWELPTCAGKTDHGEEEWYFFSPRERKYPNGARPNRATTSGYWKATGTDKAIYDNNKYVGVKKALVFYKGRPPRGAKTGWIMHEYRLSTSSAAKPRKPGGSMRLDDWVLCRIYEKKHHKQTEAAWEPETAERGDGRQRSPLRFPKSCSLVHLLEEEYMSISEMLNDYPSTGDGGGFYDAGASGFVDDGDGGGLAGWSSLDGSADGKQTFSLGNPPASFGDQPPPLFQF